MLRRALKPCDPGAGHPGCPWRRDQAVGNFPPERYASLRNTVHDPETGSAGLTNPLFACHKSPPGREIACAGWLAVEGDGHVRVRLAVSTGEIPACALRAGDDWPELYESFDEMATANGSAR